MRVTTGTELTNAFYFNPNLLHHQSSSPFCAKAGGCDGSAMQIQSRQNQPMVFYVIIIILIILWIMILVIIMMTMVIMMIITILHQSRGL